MGAGILGGFEHQVLLAAMNLDEAGAYTVNVVEMLEDRTGRAPAPAAVFTTLKRLEARGLLRSSMEPSPVGGRPRRMFYLEPEGRRVLRESREALERLWAGPPAEGRTS